MLQARDKLQTFLATAPTPALASEARGWLARVHYLTGDYAAAAKIYLNELSVADSALSHDSLLISLHMLFPYNGSDRVLADHLEEYFDTPTHALFVVNLVTNPLYEGEERHAMSVVGQKVIASLQHHRELFHSGNESDALVLALMRAALYMGDPTAALEYARLVPAHAAIVKDPDFNWMKAAGLFLRREYAAAEAPLLAMHWSSRSDDKGRAAAAQGLIGVYQKLQHPVDQLHAAFLYCQATPAYHENQEEGSSDWESRFIMWPYAGWSFDLPYLLDVQLTDRDLQEYLQRYPQASKIKLWTEGPHHYRSAAAIVEYALAVRHARREEYQEAAEIYQRLGSRPRALRMRQLARLYAQSLDLTKTGEQRFEAKVA